MNGRLIVVEGLDGVGKTTLSQVLAERLGARWGTTPDRSLRAVRDAIDARWGPGERSLFYAGAVVQAGRDALTDLAEGRDVVLDRYWATTWAYAVASGGDVDLEGIEARVVPADMTVWVECAEAERVRRLAARGISRLDAECVHLSATLRRAYEVVLARSVSGPVVLADTTHAGTAALAADLVDRLRDVPARGRARTQLALFA